MLSITNEFQQSVSSWGLWSDTYLCVSHTGCGCKRLLCCLCFPRHRLIVVVLLWVGVDLCSPILVQQDVDDFSMALQRSMDQCTLATLISMAHLAERGTQKDLQHWSWPVRWPRSGLFVSSASQNRSWNCGGYETRTVVQDTTGVKELRVFCHWLKIGFIHGKRVGHALQTHMCVSSSLPGTLTLAPFLPSRLTMSTCPAAVARQRGVMPLSVVPSTGAPISSSSATISTCPRCAWMARMGARPTTSVHQVTLAPPSINRRLTCRMHENKWIVHLCAVGWPDVLFSPDMSSFWDLKNASGRDSKNVRDFVSSDICVSLGLSQTSIYPWQVL